MAAATAAASTSISAAKPSVAACRRSSGAFISWNVDDGFQAMPPRRGDQPAVLAHRVDETLDAGVETIVAGAIAQAYGTTW